jgi:hypothetical protein
MLPPSTFSRHPQRTARSLQLVEQCFCLFEIGGGEALGEPAVDRGEQVAGGGAATTVAPQPGEATGGAQFPQLGFLLSGDAEGLATQFLGGLGLPLPQQQPASLPIELRGEPALPRPFAASPRRGALSAGRRPKIRNGRPPPSGGGVAVANYDQ